MDTEITDSNIEQERQRIIGRTIVGIKREPTPTEDWVIGQNHVTLILDDGQELHFDGWGHDASGVTLTVTRS